MNLRVTPNMSAAQAVAANRLQMRNQGALQLQASTGLRLHRPSDDPVAMRAVLTAKAQTQRLDTELANLRDARHRLDSSVTNLLDANTIVGRAKQIALDGRQSVDPQERQTLAAELDRLMDRLLQVANTNDSGQFLYAGQSTSTRPFVLTGVAEGAAVRYQGAHERGTIGTPSGGAVDALYTGREVFQPISRGSTVVLGVTGAAAGSGANSGIGKRSLRISHTSTTYAPGSGVQPGSSSLHGDTLLGPLGTNRLTITDTSGTGASGTISLNGGPPLAFTSAKANLRIVGNHGEVAYLDTTAITAGFSGEVAITADGTLSLDGGVSSIPIDFGANQQVIDSATGQVVNIDSSGIRQAGNASLEFTGTSDAFTALRELRDDLLNVRNLPSHEWNAALDRRVGELDRHRDNLLAIVGDQSATLESIQATENRTAEIKLNLASVISEHESADIVEVALNLQNTQNLLQYSLAVTARLFDQNLLNFLR